MSFSKKHILIAVFLIAISALLKVVTYPDSFNPIIAVALFSGAVFTDKKMAFIIPLFAMLLSDIVMEVSGIAPGFYGWGQLFNYGCLMAVTTLGFLLKKINLLSVAGFSVASTILFYFLSNSGVYIFSSGYYAPNLSGYVTCMEAGIPFMLKRIPVDLLFSAIFFGVYYFVTARERQAVAA